MTTAGGITIGIEETEETELENYPEGSIFKPDWQIGDSWSMGYDMDLSELESELKNSFSYLGANIKRCNIEGEVGLYQSAEVIDDDKIISIDGKKYTCYDVYFEQYVGAVYRLDVSLTLDISDYYDYEESEESYYYDDFYYGSRATVIKESEGSYETNTMTMTMDEKGYVWLEGDVTGHIFYTVDDLAVAKGIFEMVMDMEMDLEMSMSSEDQGTINIEMSYGVVGFNADFEVEYNPPLDIFDFPIEPNEYWSATSNVTKTLNTIGGKAYLNAKMSGPNVPNTNMDNDVDLGEEIYTPDVYGPFRETYYFYNPDTESIRLSNGKYTECSIIEPDEGYWDDYYGWKDYDYDGYSGMEEYEESSYYSPYPGLDVPDISGAYDFDAETMTSPIETTVSSKNYYSEEKGNIISYKQSASESNSGFLSAPIPSSDGDILASPKTYSEVTDFKTVKREEMKNKYPNTMNTGGDEKGDDPTWTVLIIAMIAIFLLVVILGGAIYAKKKGSKKRLAATTTQRYYPTAPLPTSLERYGSGPVHPAYPQTPLAQSKYPSYEYKPYPTTYYTPQQQSSHPTQYGQESKPSVPSVPPVPYQTTPQNIPYPTEYQSQQHYPLTYQYQPQRPTQQYPTYQPYPSYQPSASTTYTQGLRNYSEYNKTQYDDYYRY